MAKDISVEQLHEELLKWKETRDFLNREIAAVEQSTKNISVWMAENTDRIYQQYHDVFDSIRYQDAEKLEKTLDAMGEFAGTILKIPNADGKSILSLANEMLGDDESGRRIFARLNAVEQEFPEDLYAPVEGEAGQDAEKDTADTETDHKDAAEDKSSDDETTDKEKDADKKKGWTIWPWGGEKKEKPSDVMQEIMQVRGELLGLKTSKPFYVNSFFDWIESMHLPPEGKPEVLGDGDYIDYLNRTYRNPDYLLTQVYNDCNESLQVIFEDLCANAQAYDAVKAAYIDQDLEQLPEVLAQHKENHDIITRLLKDHEQTSLVTWALDAFDAGKARTTALDHVLAVAPETLTLDIEKNTATDIFNTVFDLVLEDDASLEPSALLSVYNALKKQPVHADVSALEVVVIGTKPSEAQLEQVEEAKKALKKALTDENKNNKDSLKQAFNKASGSEQVGQSGQRIEQTGQDGETPQEGQTANDNPQEPLTPLQIAAQKGHVEILRVLLAQSKEDMDQKIFPSNSKFAQVLTATEETPDKTKDVLHRLFQVLGQDTDAIDTYVDMRNAMRDGKTQRVSNILSGTDRVVLDEWLILRDAFEPDCSHVMDAILETAKTDNGRASLFKAATAAGIPPIFISKQQDPVFEMEKTLYARLETALETGKKADFDIFEGTLNFVVSNTTQEQYEAMLTGKNSGYAGVVGTVLNTHTNDTAKRDAYFDVLFARFEKDIEVAEVLRASAKKQTAHAETLLPLADEKASPYVQMAKDESASVIIPEKTSHLYHGYGAMGYFAGAKSGQSETDIPENNAATYIDIIEDRPGFVRVGDDLLRPENWDLMVYNGQYGDLEVFKNNTDRISFAMDNKDIDALFQKSQELKEDFVTFEDMMLIDATRFTSIRYDAQTKDIVFDQDLVISDVSAEDFKTLMTALQQKNDDIFVLESENLLLNTRKIDGVYKRVLEYYDPQDGEWEEETVELLVNGRNILAKDLLGEREYGLETDIDAQAAQDDALVAEIVKYFDTAETFKALTADIAVNTQNVASAKIYGDNGQDTIMLVGENKYSLEYQIDADAQGAKPASGLMAESFNADAARDENAIWANPDRILDAPFIEIVDGNLQVVLHGEEINIDAKGLKKQLKATHTEVLTDFFCNTDTICEASIHTGDDPRVVLKTASEDVSIDVNAEDIPSVAKKLGLENTVLSGTNAAEKASKLKKAAVLSFYKKDSKRNVSETLGQLKTLKKQRSDGAKTKQDVFCQILNSM